MSGVLDLMWQRPNSSEFPKIWRTFKVKDLESDAFVEYQIQDLPESRSEEAVEFMIKIFCSDEPLTEAHEGTKDANAIEYFRLIWKSLLMQKMTLACFEYGSDEIVGISVNYVKCKGDTFWEELDRKIRSESTDRISELMSLLCEKFDPFKQYAVDMYLDTQAIAIKKKYRGRGIAEHFLRCSKFICKEFKIKLTSTIFTSDFSNRIADKNGFKLDKIIRYEDIRNAYPNLNVPHINSSAMTIKSIFFDDI
ncbi:uncharacterized protein LOC129568527 [Sitodiplosis mosellana]|uniref:uncharacterized protein LOC129568527 n=1 Tax=Sitodiplosis mosellana TaxID=263140 RepID=UPI002443D34A|nr:uncharacterized protein LOC129568527 [Sitodiplosis mosellana]XP_055302496.1 uncharacterized protein LOC129568527 [Sitodiplosis mosellana]XP_055302497.1 uncharacterized protein LOC129568527 [Sitodiplosis mosellana]XP_055302499.1 uncharacterized protein LOC129568527 [Sitodiplosis mosellana]